MCSESVSLLLALLAVLAIVCATAGRAGAPQGFEAGPQNLALYDSPYKNYPHYEGRSALQWDGDRRCAAFCPQTPCTIWCR